MSEPTAPHNSAPKNVAPASPRSSEAAGAFPLRSSGLPQRKALPMAFGGASLNAAGVKAPVRRPESTEATAVESETADRKAPHRRFDRATRLFGEDSMHALRDSRVLVIGLGGVGSFAAESLARSGVGELVLIDFDSVCVTNANRQLHALRGNIGKSKVNIMAERLRLVDPTATINPINEFYEAETSDRLLSGQVDFVVDAIDNMTAKAHLLATCLKREIPVVSSMGAAARLDPSQIAISDLSDTTRDQFAKALRKLLRKEHGIPCKRGEASGITAVYSRETSLAPLAPSYDAAAGFQCVCPNNQNNKHSCEKRRRIDGSASFVTGAFGLAAASVVVRSFIQREEVLGH